MPSMPGSGTWVPLVVLVPPLVDEVLEVEDDVEDEVDELVEDEVDELVLVELEVLPVQFFLQ